MFRVQGLGSGVGVWGEGFKGLEFRFQDSEFRNYPALEGDRAAQ